jgi:hypothetical protein
MKLMVRRKTRMVGSACLLTVSAALGLPLALATAQAPPAPTAPPAPHAASAATLPKKIYTKSLAFDLPILMEEITRQGLREVRLFVKTPGGNWVHRDTVPPSATKFNYRAPQDGEYWFSLVTVDKSGRPTPVDVNMEAPGLRVVVDSQPPALEIQVVPGAEGECALRCTMHDANPDPSALRALGRGVAGDAPLDTVPGQPGVFRVRPEMMSSPIRVMASDLAGNSVVREVNVKDFHAAARPSIPENQAFARPPLPEPLVPSAPPALSPATMSEKPAALPEVNPPAPYASHLTKEAPARMPLLPVDGGAMAVKAGSVQRRLINTTRACIEYRIDHAGASGVGKVEVYVTHDQGNTWRRLCEDADRQSPAEIDLPGEGLFGVRLAITNGNGFGGTPPARGDVPQCWIEVDSTAPFVQLRPAEPVAGGGAIDIRWSASDPNIAPEPVSLFYRVRPDGLWQPIIRGLRNEGVYRWTFPRDIGTQFFLKVEVADLAGNIGASESQVPVVLDMTEPRASVIGVTGMSKTH